MERERLTRLDVLRALEQAGEGGLTSEDIKASEVSRQAAAQALLRANRAGQAGLIRDSEGKPLRPRKYRLLPAGERRLAWLEGQNPEEE